MIILNYGPASITVGHLNDDGNLPLRLLEKCTRHNQNSALFGWSLVLINLLPLSLVLELTVDMVTDEAMMKLSHGLRDHIQEAWLNGWRATEA